ncbi:response regulator receiver domain-containing protein [Paramagnetospirillum caucaseum]|uniref:Response regulator receiver domain-containing protein n=1 Tax=Paramagnetospirillum caucaseum TaxID=1244869 RepID=M2Z397_9PROT|nr:response regulator [Paramagnetospirillum caucaseum]EME68830.1 response regulator receiver domain-containing protein [Paramagnetospirillum caucaseum]
MTVPLSRILYVDDEVILQKVVRISLEKLGGFTVAVAGSGEEALEAIPAFRPDLILLDVMMPGMDGPDTLAALRADSATRGLPVIFITAKAQAEEIGRFHSLGVADVITKPFEPADLVAQIRRVWAALQ